ncbi:hypothetical protein BGX29_006615 [Mortierella sp. GBA35]|nr:hypothetical protein BGX23_005481 [Mortierella sp. AD031]KAF9100400.1 hypothetical protein BGX29_006615 [Mortierella sp. GBA35]
MWAIGLVLEKLPKRPFRLESETAEEFTEALELGNDPVAHLLEDIPDVRYSADDALDHLTDDRDYWARRKRKASLDRCRRGGPSPDRWRRQD